MVKRKKAESAAEARRRRIRHTNTAVKHVKNLETKLQGLKDHMAMMASDNHSPGK
jgi:hypothetical protein